MRRLLVVLTLLTPLSFAARPSQRHGMVVAVSPPGADVGRDVLLAGGNAVDAAVATAFAMAVTYPSAGNLGGGGFMLVHPATGKGEPVVIDYRETAPLAASRTMFTKKDTWYSHRAVGVPGTVAGLYLAHQRFGRLPWKDVVSPAVRLAGEGFVIDAQLASSLGWALRGTQVTPEFVRAYGKDGGKSDWQAGDRIVLSDLARTLRRIQERGPDGFYKGETAELIVQEMRAGGGLISAEDLARYRAKLREPIRGSYRGYDVYAPPPPSSGGVCLVEMLNILETFDLNRHPRYSAETLHLMTEAMRRAYRDRAAYLGDQDFVKNPAHLTTKEYARKLALGIDLKKATPSESLAGEIKLADEKTHTTHYSVLDASGMAVSTTTTLEDSFGSKVVVRGGGFLLNNEMTDFNPVPGVTNRKGQVGTEPNLIAPGKRMLSSMTPTILVKDGRPALITGSPGGRTIINTVLGVVVNVVDYDMPLHQAVDAPRMHQQWFPDRVQLETATWEKHADAVTRLEKMGHRVLKVRAQGDAHSICYNAKGGRYEGVMDPRRAGRPAAFRE
ncbi:MAG: gamma-glutamyltransferase [Gemmataceae bacterium]